MTISTHVLDAATGRPASGVDLRLLRLEGADLHDATEIGSGTTNDDGRCPELTDAVDLAVGVYRLWRDLGYAVGALIAGLTADAFGLSGAMWIVAAVTLLSGVEAALRLDETVRLSAA